MANSANHSHLPTVPPDKLQNNLVLPSQMISEQDKRTISNNVEKVLWWDDADIEDDVQLDTSVSANGKSELYNLQIPRNNCVHIGTRSGLSGSIPQVRASTINDSATEETLCKLLSNDKDIYTQVIARKRRQSYSNWEAKKVAIEAPKNRNYYAPLDTDENEAEHNSAKGIKEAQSNGRNNNIIRSGKVNSSDDINKKTTQQQTEEDSWCPPIFTKGLSSKTVIEFLSKSKYDLNNIKFVTNGFCRLKIFVRGIELHSFLMEYFKKCSIDAFTFTPKQKKKFNLVLKGLSGNFSPVEVQKEFLKLDASLALTVKKFETKWSKENEIPLDLFHCVLEDRESMVKIKKISSLLRHRIRWDSVRSSGTRQCYRCQRFGHVSNYCSFALRCVKCLQFHEFGKCEVGPKSESSVASCVNCGKAGHPASYKGCPSRVEYLKKKESVLAAIKSSKAGLRNSVISQVNKVPNLSFSYADAARGGKLQQIPASAQPNVKPENDISDFMEESNKLFGLPISQLIAKIRDFWPKYNKLDDNQKPGAYLSFIASLSPHSP